MSAAKSRPRDLRRRRRDRRHSCWDHLLVAPLWVADQRIAGWRVIAVELAEDATPLVLLEPARQRTVVLLGHEREGVPDHLVEAADACVEIPMVGRGASLNVAVAGSLVLYRLAGLA